MKNSSLKFLLFFLCLTISFSVRPIQSSAQNKVYWSTYLKGQNPDIAFDSQDMAEDIVVDDNGDAYVVGRTNSVKSKNNGTYKHGVSTSGVAFIAKVNKCGVIKWVSYLGNDNLVDCPASVSCSSAGLPLTPHGCSEWSYCAAIDHDGPNTYIFMGGEIMNGASGTPVLVGGVSPYHAATSTSKDRWDGFVAKYNAKDGTLVNWTYLSGSNSAGCINPDGQAVDEVLAIAVDGNHDVYATGYTESDNLGSTDNGYVASNYRTFTTGNGGDCFIARFDKNLTTLKNIEYFGGDKNDRSHSIVISDDPVYGRCLVVGGSTQSDTTIFIRNTAFTTASHPYDSTLGSIQDAFVLKWKISDYISAAPLGPYWVTYVGGTGLFGLGSERGRGIDVDDNGIIYFTGWTDATKKLGTDKTTSMYPNPLGDTDGFLSKIAPDGSLVWMTYLGGSKEDRPNSLRVFTSNSINYIVIGGGTQSTDCAQIGCNDIRCTPIGGRDAFVCEIEDCDPLVGYCNGKRQTLVMQDYLGGDLDEFDRPISPAGQNNADYIFSSYGPSMDIRSSDNTIYFAFSTRSDSTSIHDAITPDHWTRTPDKLQDSVGDAFVGKIVPITYSDNCSFSPREETESEWAITQSLDIAPNPFTHSFQMSFDADADGSADVLIYNMLGQIILEEPMSIINGENSEEFDLSSQPSGIYFCKINFHGSLSVAKVVKE